MKYQYVVLKVVIWLVLMCAYLFFFTLSTDNSLSLQPDWFSGNRNAQRDGIIHLVAYANPGFPIQIDGSSTNGPYWLAWAINVATALAVGALTALVLHKAPFRNRKRS